MKGDAKVVMAYAGTTLPVKRSYAVVWSCVEDVGSGRLEARSDGFELYGRDRRLSVRFSDLASASIARVPGERLRGLPVLVLRPRSGAPIRIGSLEGPGVLHELAQYVEQAGLVVAA
jgi:hypothetical protein